MNLEQINVKSSSAVFILSRIKWGLVQTPTTLYYILYGDNIRSHQHIIDFVAMLESAFCVMI